MEDDPQRAQSHMCRHLHMDEGVRLHPHAPYFMGLLWSSRGVDHCRVVLDSVVLVTTQGERGLGNKQTERKGLAGAE